MKLKLLNDLEIGNGTKSLEVLKNNTRIFHNWNVKEISELSEYLRFLSFSKSTLLAKKDEKLDYFGIIISGRALITAENTVFGYLETGDMIGYLNFAKFEGTQTNYFNITGEKEGYIATIRADDYKIMSKKSPLIAYKFSQIVTKKALDVINFQYKNEHFLTDVQPTPSILPPKRIIDMFEKSPAFQHLIKRMEKRDRANFLKYSQLFEFSSKELICRKNTRCGQLIFLLKGELTQFNEEKDTVETFHPGDIVGLPEFYADLSWNSNVIAKSDGCYIVLKSEHLTDLALENGISAINLYTLFSQIECENIKQSYEKEFKEKFSMDFRFRYLPQEQQSSIKLSEINKDLEKKEEEDSKESNMFGAKKKKEEKKVKFPASENPEDYIIHNFLEIDVEKKIDYMSISTVDSSARGSLEPYKIDVDVAPLYVHEIHKYYIEKPSASAAAAAAASAGTSNNKKPAENAIQPADGISVFYREKLEKQQIAMQKLKQLQRQQKKDGVPAGDPKKAATDSKEKQSEEYEELKNELAIIDQSKNEMQRMLDEVKEENKGLRLEINRLNDTNTLLNAKVNKGLVQRELIKKDIINQGTLSSLHGLSNSIQDSFHTVLNQQLRINRGSQVAARCAYKWLLITKKNLLKKKSQVK